ncbi:hypothetical protein AEQ67_27260 [Pseudomonas sp. RIT-PI-q]|nr:hypothetical protein AEQ67_27260 [Pseudomonas sp. RIT-PI-q]
MNDATVDAEAIHGFLIQPLIRVADAVVGLGETRIEKVVRPGGPCFAHGFIKTFRRTRAADHGEILDEAIEGDFGNHVRSRVAGTAWRDEGALGDVDERVRLNAQVVHAAAVAMVEQARIAHVVASPFGHIADIHAATKRQNGQQQNQATHPILQRPVTENRRMASGCSFRASSGNISG